MRRCSLGIAAGAVLAGICLPVIPAQADWHGRGGWHGGWHEGWHGGWGWHGGHWGCCWRGGVFIGAVPPVYVPPPVYYAPPPVYYPPPYYAPYGYAYPGY